MCEDLVCHKYVREIHNEILSTSEHAQDVKKIHFKNQFSVALQTLKVVDNKATIIVIGGDKSGKSALINYLLGNSLVVRGPTNRQDINIISDNDSPGPQISMRAHQQVRVPTVWTSNKIPGRKLIVEFPGHGKFSSVDQEKFNNAIAPVIYGSVKRAKLVLVWNVTDILYGKFREYEEQVKFLENLFDSYLLAFIPDISVVFTHVPKVYGDHRVNIDYIIQIIGQFAMKDNHLSPLAKQLLHEISGKPSSHGVFQKLTSQGPLTSCLDVNVSQSLLSDELMIDNDLLGYSLFETISHGVSIFSQELAATIGVTTFTSLEKAVSRIAKVTCDSNTAEKLNDQKQRLMNCRQWVRQGLEPRITIRVKIGILEALDPALEKIVKEGQLHKKLDLAKTVKNNVRLTIRRLLLIDKAMDHLLIKMFKELESMIENVDLQLRILKEVEVAQQLKKNNEKLERETIKLMKRINLMRHNEQRRKHIARRIFRHDPIHVAGKIVDILKYCTRPVLYKLQRMSVIKNMVRSGVLVSPNAIEREERMVTDNN